MLPIQTIKTKVDEQSKKTFDNVSKFSSQIAQNNFVNKIKAKLAKPNESYIINIENDAVSISDPVNKKTLSDKLDKLIKDLRKKLTISNASKTNQKEILKNQETTKSPEISKPLEQPQSKVAQLKKVEHEAAELKKNFVAGKGEEVVQYVKGKTQTTGVEQRVVFGPQLKNEETNLMENILGDLLEDTGKYQFVKDPNSEQWRIVSEGKILYKQVRKDKNEAGEEVATVHYVFDAQDPQSFESRPDNASLISSEPVDLGQFIKEVNFNHMTFSEAQLDAYAKKHEILEELAVVELKQNPKVVDKNLSNAEKAAINVYSTFEYSSIQLVMQGNLEKIRGDIKHPNRSDNIKENLLTAAIAVHGLNKLPDYKSEIQEMSPEFLFRYEKITRLPKEVLEERINAVQAGGKVTTVAGFLSTAHTSPAQGFENDILIVYENCKGKDIAKISSHPDENEVLLPPTQVQWVGYHKLLDEAGKELHVFVARAVTAGSFERASTRPSEEEIAENLPQKKNNLNDKYNQ